MKMYVKEYETLRSAINLVLMRGQRKFSEEETELLRNALSTLDDIKARESERLKQKAEFFAEKRKTDKVYGIGAKRRERYNELHGAKDE